MIFADYPEISREDYKIPNGIPADIMIELNSGGEFDKRLHDYIILVGSGKFSVKQIRRVLYLTRYGYYRLKKKYQAIIQENVAKFMDKK